MASEDQNAESSRESVSNTLESTEERRNVERQSAQYGNFRNYYSIRGGAGNDGKDTRIDDIVNFLSNNGEAHVYTEADRLRILDIGCNSGEVTREISQAMQGKAECIIGVDIDRELVLLASSRIRKIEQDKMTIHPDPIFAPRILGAGRAVRGKATFEPRKRLRIEEPTSQPAYLGFYQANWVYNDQLAQKCREKIIKGLTRMQIRDSILVEEKDLQQYNVIFALSVTKWIHIQHHDLGIRRFFARVVSCLAPNGIFILEQQGYKSYKQTLKITAPDSLARMNFYSITVMPDDFALILTLELGLRGPFRIRDKGHNASIRQIDAYIKPTDELLSAHFLDRRAALLKHSENSNSKDSIAWVARDRQTCE